MQATNPARIPLGRRMHGGRIYHQTNLLATRADGVSGPLCKADDGPEMVLYPDGWRWFSHLATSVASITAPMTIAEWPAALMPGEAWVEGAPALP